MVKSDGYIHPSIYPRICVSGSRHVTIPNHSAAAATSCAPHAGCRHDAGDGPPVGGDSRAAGELEHLLTNARACVALLAASLPAPATKLTVTVPLRSCWVSSAITSSSSDAAAQHHGQLSHKWPLQSKRRSPRRQQLALRRRLSRGSRCLSPPAPALLWRQARRQLATRAPEEPKAQLGSLQRPRVWRLLLHRLQIARAYPDLLPSVEGARPRHRNLKLEKLRRKFTRRKVRQLLLVPWALLREWGCMNGRG